MYLGGLECENGSKLIKDLRGTLGKTFPLIAPDGFSSFSDTWKNSGGVANGMYISVAGQPNSKLPPAGKAFVEGLRRPGRAGPEPVLRVRGSDDAGHARRGRRRPAATAPRSPTRCSSTKVTNGILGTFTINANGDTSSNPVTQYKLVTPGKGVPYKTITPPASLVKVA